MENEFFQRNYKGTNNVERIYVDWPEIDNDEFRFISSRMEDPNNDAIPLVFQQDLMNSKFQSFNLDQLKLIENSVPPDLVDNRYEDISKRRTTKHLKNSSVPPLDLISQNSSIEIPGTKGIIDIDLRSSSESLSNSSHEYKEQLMGHLERDSLDGENLNPYNLKGDQYSQNNFNPLLNTTLPEVKRADLMLNPGEYDSSRINQPNAHVMRKLSEISVPSQYQVDHQNDKTSEIFESRTEMEKAAFEAARQRYRQPARNINKNSHESQKTDSNFGSQPLKPVKGKPTLLVAPLIKNSLYNVNNIEKSINFIELNKITTNSQKQPNQSSYTSKFIDRHKKESPKPPLRKSASFKDSWSNQNLGGEQLDFANVEFQKKRGKSVEKPLSDNFKVDHHEISYINKNLSNSYNYLPDSMNVLNPSQFVYAYTQYGEPIILNTESITITNNNSKHVNSYVSTPQHSNFDDHNSTSNIFRDNPVVLTSSPKHQKLFTNNQETRNSNESDFIFKDAAFKRQPTLYDENLLNRKLKEIKAERIESRFPPIPNSSDSKQSSNAGYSSIRRKKEVNYEQYTLRDFRNFKQIDRAVGLGPNIGSDSHVKMKEKLARQTNYAKAVHEKNRKELARQSEKIITDKSKIIENPIEKLSSPNDYESINYISAHDDIVQLPQRNNDKETQSDDVREDSKTNQKSTSSSSKDHLNKRETMLVYAKSLQEKQVKKRVSKDQVLKTQSASTIKDVSKNFIHELIDNSDLDRLVQRHENDKRIADEIRQKLGKIS